MLLSNNDIRPMGRDSYYVWDVFSDEDARHSRFVDAIAQYHLDTGKPILLPRQRQAPSSAPPSTPLWHERLLPHHLEMVRSYLPQRVIREARRAHYRKLYHRLKRRVVFVGEALSQVRGHDPFFLSMDDVHDADAALTSMTSWMAYYAERMVS